MLSFLNVTNELLEQRGIALPLEGQATTTPGTRLEKGAINQNPAEGVVLLDEKK